MTVDIVRHGRRGTVRLSGRPDEAAAAALGGRGPGNGRGTGRLLGHQPADVFAPRAPTGRRGAGPPPPLRHDDDRLGEPSRAGTTGDRHSAGPTDTAAAA